VTFLLQNTNNKLYQDNQNKRLQKIEISKKILAHEKMVKEDEL
jgi:hypothetical protein